MLLQSNLNHIAFQNLPQLYRIYTLHQLLKILMQYHSLSCYIELSVTSRQELIFDTWPEMLAKMIENVIHHYA